MADWRERAEISEDVVFFRYALANVEKEAREVFVWDLDKTYLDTHFESPFGLVKTALEKAFQKKNVPGTATLVRALRDSLQGENTGGDLPIYFITASPPQMELRIHQKLNLDGIYPFGIFFKDNLRNLKPARLWRLTQQVGYKIQALLQMRKALGERVRQVMWGDDSEADAVIYSLYSDICARRLRDSQLEQILKFHRVTGDQTEMIMKLQQEVPEQDPIEKVYINLADDTDAEYYAKFGRRTLPTYNSFQVALDLFQDQRLSAEQVANVADDLTANYSFTTEELQNSLLDLIHRKILGSATVDSLVPYLLERKVLSNQFLPPTTVPAITARVGARVFEVEGATDPWIPDYVDYFRDYR
jgi:hypothetical protein